MELKTVQMFQDFSKLVWEGISSEAEQKRWFDIKLLEFEESDVEFKQEIQESDFLEGYMTELFEKYSETEILEKVREDKTTFEYLDYSLEQVNETYKKCRNLKRQS